MSELYGFKKNLEKVQVRSKSESAAKSHIVPTLIDNNPMACRSGRYDYTTRIIPELANWNVVVLTCKCGNINQNIVYFRGSNTQNYLIDALTSTVTRAGYYVDWANNSIRVRWVDGKQELIQSFVQILAVYGLVQNVDVVDQDTEDEGGDEGEDIDITGLTEEVQGIRIGADGTIYETAGDAVRQQYERLAERLDLIGVEDVMQQINDAIAAIPTEVEQWLDDHPEATTTVQDGAITEAKLADALQLKTIKDYVTPQMYGATGNGSTDDTQAFVDMFADSVNKNVYIPTGRYKITSTITINNAVRIFGDGFTKSVIVFAGTGTAFSINVNYVTFESIRLYNVTYYTDSVNSNTGIEANGTSENHYYGLQIIDCDIKGFQTNIYIHYGWSCKIIGTNSNYCLYGIRVNGLSVNSEIDGCHFTTTYNTLTKENNSIGIYFEGGTASEGWKVVNCLTYGFVIGVLLEDITHCIISNNIFDFCYHTGIELRGTNYFSGNHYINNNYIAVSSSGDFAEKSGIATSVNKSSSQYRGNSIVGNLILCYATNTSLYATFGIKFLTSQDQKSSIIGNHIYHCNTGIRVACYSTVVIGNVTVDCPTYGINVAINGSVTNVDLMPIVANNQGTVYKSLNNKSKIMDRNIMMKNEPFNGVNDGDIILSSSPTSSGTLGWVCVISGEGKFKPILLGDTITVS